MIKVQTTTSETPTNQKEPRQARGKVFWSFLAGAHQAPTIWSASMCLLSMCKTLQRQGSMRSMYHICDLLETEHRPGAYETTRKYRENIILNLTLQMFKGKCKETSKTPNSAHRSAPPSWDEIQIQWGGGRGNNKPKRQAQAGEQDASVTVLITVAKRNWTT